MRIVTGVRHFACWTLAYAATAAIAQQPYTLKMHSEEVAMSFHVVDERGLPVSDLVATDLHIRDNGRAPLKITHFIHHNNLPLRIAMVYDMSASMQGAVSPREIARRVAQTAILKPGDQAMIVRFDFETQIEQDWTSDSNALMHAAAHVTDANGSRLGGTAIWDTLYRVCHDHIPVQPPGAEVSANAIILFTDGEDNHSHALPQDVIEECGRRQTAIYPLVVDDKARFDKGQHLLRELAEKTGGHVFYAQGSPTKTAASIMGINNELRDRYTVIYRPAKLKLNGSFHTVKIDCPKRTAFFVARDGYYAAE